jgi:hypothetical protein
MSKRYSQDTAVNRTGRIASGGAVVYCCHHCSRFMVALCQETGDKIKWPISGPIPDNCPLEKARREDDADEKIPLNGPATRARSQE